MSNSDLPQRIAKDMEKSGFPLEIEAGARFSNRDWTVRHQAIFWDADEKKSRNIDIIAHKLVEQSFRDYGRLNFTVICECKKSNKPWVFYTPLSSELREKDFATLFYLKTASRPLLLPQKMGFLYNNHYVAATPVDRLGQAHYIAFVGGEEKRSDGYDQVYVAVNQVLKATVFRQTNLKDLVSGLTTPTILIVFYPVIIFDGKMFQYNLVSNKPELEETHYVKYRAGLLGSSQLVESQEFLIDVISKDFLDTYLGWLDAEMKAIISA